MQVFTSKIVNLMKENELFSWQGGPIIMAQVVGESVSCCLIVMIAL